MLEYIRSSAQSFGVKIAFGVIILVFVFWGVGNFNDRDYSNVVAVVNGEPIVALEFEKAYHNAEEYMLRANPGLTREELAKQHLGRQVLRELIQATLLAQEARRSGVAVSPQEMRLAVDNIKAFQNEKGQFDPEAYKRVLEAQRMSPAQYEKTLADELLREKMFSLVTASAWVDPEEAKNRFNFLRERRVVDYLFIAAAPFENKVEIGDKEMKTYYDGHEKDFAIPPKVDIEYIEIAPAALVNKADITDAEARALYQANIANYARPEQAHARHILITLPPDADEAAQKTATGRLQKAKADIAAGKSFADVADSINEANAADKGGDLGWIKRGETVPEFEEALFALSPGQVSEIVKTPFGLHLIKLEEKKEAGTAPFEEVSEDIYHTLATEKGSDKLHEVLDALIEDNILMKPLSECAAKFNLKSAQTGLTDKNGLVEKLKIKDDGAAALMAVPAGAPLDTALEAGDNYIVARVIKSEPAGVKSFDSVKGEIKNILVREQSLSMAMKEAGDILTKIKTEPLAQSKKQYPGIKSSAPLERGGMIEGFLPEPKLMEAIFDNTVGQWLSTPQAVAQADGAYGAMLARVDHLVAPNEGEYESVAQILENATKQDRMAGIFELFMAQLGNNAKIEIANQDIIDRVGR